MEMIGGGALPVQQQRAMAFLIEGLSPRQRVVAVLLASGLTPRDIAERLAITRNSAAAYVREVTTKLGAPSPKQIASLLAAYRMDPQQALN